MKLFVWDLHGTLEQGNEQAVIDISNRVLRRFGYDEQFEPAHSSQLYGLKWHQYFAHLLPSESQVRHHELQIACFELSNSDAGTAIIADYMRPAAFAHEVLAAIASSRHEQILISNTTPATIPLFVAALGMEGHFSASNAFAVDQHAKDAKRTKVDVLKEYLISKPFDELVVIGDSPSDMVLAETVGARGYLYAHVGTPFREANAYHKTHDLRDVLAEL